VLWVFLYVAIAVAGLAVLAALTWRLWRQVRSLGREVSAASRRLADASAALAEVQARLPTSDRPELRR
jgi:hypothetical protein